MGEEATSGVLKTGKCLPDKLERHTDVLELRLCRMH